MLTERELESAYLGQFIPVHHQPQYIDGPKSDVGLQG